MYTISNKIGLEVDKRELGLIQAKTMEHMDFLETHMKEVAKEYKPLHDKVLNGNLKLEMRELEALSTIMINASRSVHEPELEKTSNKIMSRELEERGRRNHISLSISRAIKEKYDIRDKDFNVTRIEEKKKLLFEVDINFNNGKNKTVEIILANVKD